MGAREHEEDYFCFVPFQYVRWFRFEFSHKPESRRPDGRPLFFFSRPRPNVSRLRRPGAVRAQPCQCLQGGILASFLANLLEALVCDEGCFF